LIAIPETYLFIQPVSSDQKPLIAYICGSK